MASGKFANVYCLRMASPSSAHPVSFWSRCSASPRESFGMSQTSSEWLARANFIESCACGIHVLERFPFEVRRSRVLDAVPERVAGHDPMVLVLGLLQRLESDS